VVFRKIHLQIVLKTIFSPKNVPTMRVSSIGKYIKAEKGDKKGARKKMN